MAITWEINQFVLLVIAGYGGYDLKTVVAQIMASQKFREGLPLLVDRRTATDNPTPEEVATRAHSISKLAPVRAVLVTSAASIAYAGSLKLAAAMRSRKIETEVFVDFEKARRWLHLNASG